MKTKLLRRRNNFKKNISLLFSFLFLQLYIGELLAQTTTFNFTGAAQTFTVPPCVTSINYTVVGAGGGGANGGRGSSFSGTLTVTPGQVLQIFVGGQGGTPAAGWNGGGPGNAGTQPSGGGGGASDIRVAPYGLANRIVVAGGGGGRGGGSNFGSINGGNANCTNGQNGTNSFGAGGTGATTTAGGTGGIAWGGGTNGTNGTLGTGGTGGQDAANGAPGGGGGGGLYGGGGGGGDNCCPGANGGGGGGGGSNLAPSGATCASNINAGNGSISITVPAAPNATFTSSSTNICNGMQFTLTGNVTATGAWTLTLSNGQTTSGTGSGPWSIVVTPSASTTYTFSSLVDAVRCSTPAGSVTLTLPVMGTTLSANNQSATCLVNQNGWIDFYHSTGRLIASVNSLGQNLGNVTMTSYVDANSLAMPDCNDPTNPSYITNVMRRHWVITPSIQPTTPVQVRLPFQNTDLSNLLTGAASNVNLSDDISSIADIKLSKYSGPANVDNNVLNNCPSSGGSAGTTLHNQISNGSTTAYSSVTAASYTIHSIPNFSEFWLHGTAINSALPITLASFESVCLEEKVQLKWSTSSEQNSSHFEIEKSFDGMNWKSISEITAAGNSNAMLNYAYIDQNSLRQGLAYYRLKTVDLDGSFTISSAKSTSCGLPSEVFTLIPNPAIDHVTLLFGNIDTETQKEIVIMDINGRIVKHVFSDPQTTNLEVDIVDLSAGCYFVQLRKMNSEHQIVRFVKQ